MKSIVSTSLLVKAAGLIFVIVCGSGIFLYKSISDIAKKEAACEKQYNLTLENVSSSPTLRAILTSKGTISSKSHKEIDSPGNDSNFQINHTYILFPEHPTETIPKSVSILSTVGGMFYESLLLKSLSFKHLETGGSPMLVTSRSRQGNIVTVTTNCAIKPFEVSMNELYETTQSNDSQIILDNILPGF